MTIMATDRIRELLALDLAEQPESFDPDWITSHLDTDRIRRAFFDDFVAMVREEKPSTPTQVVLAEARAKLDELLNDPRELIAVLGGEISKYLDVHEAADDAAEHGIVPSAVRDQLQELMADLDEMGGDDDLGMCHKCQEIPVEAGEEYCDACKRDLGISDGY